MITLEQPSYAVNSNDSSYVINMMYGWDVGSDISPPQIIKRIVSVATATTENKLQHVVLNCRSKAGYLGFGQGIDKGNVMIFSALAGLVDNIWLTGSSVAYGSKGRTFCSSIAKQTEAYVFAGKGIQKNGRDHYAMGELPPYEGLLYRFNPDGEIGWEHKYWSWKWTYE